jgi:hypothetical protein
VFAQYGTIQQIDSVMDMSPIYLPTQYAKAGTIEFEPLIYTSVDTGMVNTHQFDPLFKPENIYQHLGISGQAHQSLVFDYQREMGFLYQTLPYPLFFKKQSDLQFYKLKTTYSRVAYTLSFLKENEIFAEFAQFVRGATVAVNLYGTFNEGTFARQQTRNLCGDILLHYEMPSSLYGFRASYIINNLNNYENGGVLDISSYPNKTFDSNKQYEVRFKDANSQITTHDLALQNYVNLKNKEKKYFGTFTHDFQFVQTTLRYNDKFDTIYPFYGAYNSDIETKDSTRILTFKNAIQWSNFSPYQEMSAKNNFFHIAVGGLHDYTDLKYLNTTFNSFYVFARTHIRLFKVMDITGHFSYSFSDYTSSDILAKAGISWAINREKEHKVGVNASYYRNEPEYILQHVFVNNFRWANHFQKQNIMQLKAFWNYQKYNVAVSYYYLNNLVYLSEELAPVQNKNNGNMFQFSAFVPFRYKNFGTTANLNFQYCSKDVVHVPVFSGKLSVYYIIELLKKRLKILVGTDFMYNTTYHADAYLPVLHKFYYQKSQSAGNFIYFDANLTVKIERINFFFRAGNLLAPAMNYRNSTTPNYPVKDFLFSLGINWRFYD